MMPRRIIVLLVPFTAQFIPSLYRPSGWNQKPIVWYLSPGLTRLQQFFGYD